MKNSIFRKIFSLWICILFIFVFFASCTTPPPSTTQSQPAGQESSSVATSTLPKEKINLESYTLSQQSIFSVDRFPIDTLASLEDFYFVFKETLFRSDSASSELIVEGVQQIAGYDENGFYLIVNDTSVPIIDKAPYSMQMQTSLAYYNLADKTLTTLIPGAQSAVVQPGSNDIVFYSAVIPYEEDQAQNTRWAIIRHQLNDGKETILHTDTYEDFLPLDEYATENDHAYDILLSFSNSNSTITAKLYFPYPAGGRYSISYIYNWEGTLLEKPGSSVSNNETSIQNIDCGGYSVRSEKGPENYSALKYYVVQPSKFIGDSVSYQNAYSNKNNLFYYYQANSGASNPGWSVFNGNNTDILKVEGTPVESIYLSENSQGAINLFADTAVYNEEYTTHIVSFYKLTGTTANPTAAEKLFTLSGETQPGYDGPIPGYYVVPIGNFMLFLMAEPLNFVTLDVNTNQFTAYNPALLS